MVPAISTLCATRYVKKMTTGRTSPCILACEDTLDGGEIEYVVKLKAGMDQGVDSLMFELLAVQLAEFLDVAAPKAAIIEIEASFVEVINDKFMAKRVRESIGKNFGSMFLKPGYGTWPVAKSIPSLLRPVCADIFAFDALIQNADRRVKNPNILAKGGDVYIFDHELGFSFLFTIGSSSNLDFLKDHVFYSQLKGKECSFDRFAGALESLTDDDIAEMISNVPSEWKEGNSEKIDKISNHMKMMRENVDDFAQELRGLLI